MDGIFSSTMAELACQCAFPALVIRFRANSPSRPWFCRRTISLGTALLERSRFSVIKTNEKVLPEPRVRYHQQRTLGVPDHTPLSPIH